MLATRKERIAVLSLNVRLVGVWGSVLCKKEVSVYEPLFVC